MDESQRLAAVVVDKVLSGRNHSQSLAEIWRKHQLSPAQKGAIQDLSFGVLRYFGQGEETLRRLLKKPLKDEKIRALLLVALHQLRHGQSSEHAVVHHAVEAAKKINPHASGLVNAVLRNFLRNREALSAPESETARYNHPQWWIEKLKRQYPDDFEAILDAGCRHPPMSLRVNLAKTSLAGYAALLTENGIEHTVLSGSAVVLSHPLGVDKLPGFSVGLVSVQDYGAQMAAGFLDVADGMRVLDACAAPGGKSAHLLETADIELLSLDINPARIALIEENLARLGLSAAVKAGDAAKTEEWWDGAPFERILADVPCSASGVVRRHPDIKWLRRPEDFANFGLQQEKILAALWRTLASGGKLLYATCSLFEEENEFVIAAFLKSHPDARRLPLPKTQLLPNDLHDGFFYALLQKAE